MYIFSTGGVIQFAERLSDYKRLEHTSTRANTNKAIGTKLLKKWTNLFSHKYVSFCSCYIVSVSESVLFFSRKRTFFFACT